VVQQSLAAQALGGVFLHAASEEVAELQREAFDGVLVQGGGRRCDDLEEHADGVDAEERVMRLAEFQNSHSQRPHVHLLVVLSALHHL
jgi:hypothetical protein